MSNRKPVARTPKKRAAFLDALAAGATVADAASAAGMAKRTAYDWRAADEAFAADWANAYAMGADALDDEARRRAVAGVAKPLFHQGRPVCDGDGEPVVLREYSDTLLIFLMKSRDPERYCDRVRAAKIERRWRKEDHAAGDASTPAATADVLNLLVALADSKAVQAEPSSAAE